MFAYPLIGASQLVGTDLTQAVPLTAAAALGALVFGHVQFGLTAAVVLGSVPAVLIGSFLSSRAPDKYIRPVIAFVILASGLKYAGLGTTALGWTLCAVLLGTGGWWLARSRPWRSAASAAPGATPVAAPAPAPIAAPASRAGDPPPPEPAPASTTALGENQALHPGRQLAPREATPQVTVAFWVLGHARTRHTRGRMAS